MFRTIALTLAVLAAACGAAQAQGLDGRLKRIAATGTINIAYRTDATPFAFQAEGKPAGFLSTCASAWPAPSSASSSCRPSR